METPLQVISNILGRRLRIAEALTVSRCMQFFIGWMKRFGYTKETFFVPLEQKSKSKPLRLRTLKQIGD
jgi:hypothetical protein